MLPPGTPLNEQFLDFLWQELDLEISRHGLPSRLIFAIADGAIGYRVRNSSYRNIAELSDIMASRDLKAAVDAGLLMAVGERRGRVYKAPPFRALVDKLRREYIKPVSDPFIPTTPELPFTANDHR